MSRSSLTALVLGLSLLAGCEGPKPPMNSTVPLPPMPEPRRFPLTMGSENSSLDSAPATNVGTIDPAEVVNSSSAKPLNDLIVSSGGTVDLSLSGPTYSGEPFNWSDYRGKVVVVLFWASWFPACRQDIDKLEEVHKTFCYRPLEVVAVNLDRDVEAARKFLDSAQPSFPVIMDGEQDFKLASEYPTRSIPQIVCVNKEGKIEGVTFRDPSTNSLIEGLMKASYAGPVSYSPSANKVASKTKPADNSGASESITATKKKPAATANDGNRVEAKVGVGKKGRGYGGGIYTEALKARWTVEQKLIFDVQIPKAMSLFQATNARYPESHEEFMEAIIKDNSIQLPELPTGQDYVYDPETAKLMVHQPQ